MPQLAHSGPLKPGAGWRSAPGCVGAPGPGSPGLRRKVPGSPTGLRVGGGGPSRTVLAPLFPGPRWGANPAGRGRGPPALPAWAAGHPQALGRGLLSFLPTLPGGQLLLSDSLGTSLLALWSHLAPELQVGVCLTLWFQCAEACGSHGPGLLSKATEGSPGPPNPLCKRRATEERPRRPLTCSQGA